MLKNLYVTIGMRRAGNHAISGWIASQLANRPIKTDGTFLAQDVDLVDESVSYANNVAPEILGKLANRLPLPGEKHRILSVEVCGFDIAKALETHYAEKAYIIIVLRDPRNHLASILQGGDKFSHVLTNYVSDWKHCYDLSEKLEVDGFRRNGIVFDKWFEDKSYRDSMAWSLGFENKDLGIGLVSGNGGGSSFDGVSKDGSAQDMKVNERWIAFKDNEEFNKRIDQLKHYEL